MEPRRLRTARPRDAARLVSVKSSSRLTVRQARDLARAVRASPNGRAAHDILRWAVDQFFPKLTMATAFGPEGNCIIHMLGEIEPRVRIFNLETGYQFKETLEVRERIKERRRSRADELRQIRRLR